MRRCRWYGRDLCAGRSGHRGAVLHREREMIRLRESVTLTTWDVTAGMDC